MNFLKDIFSKPWHEKLIKLAKKQGVDEGKHGRPTPLSASPDVFEENFLNEGTTLILKANSRVTEFIKKIGPAIQEANSKLDDIESESRNSVDFGVLKNKVESVKNDIRTSLTNANLKVIETEGYLNSFKATHNLKTAPDYPADTIHFLSIVFIVLVIEGCLNAVFWKNDQGLIGGFFKALAVAGINIGFGMAAGLLFRYVNYKSSWSLILGISALLLGILGSIRLNLWIASVRTSHDSFQLNPPDYSAVFQDSSSVLLLFIGLIFAMLAAYKGYYVFGSVPGYQKVCKDYESAVKEVEEIEKKLKLGIANAISVEQTKLTQLLRTLTETNKALNKIKADVKSCKSNFEATSAEVFEAVKVIVRNYRQMNSQSRPSDIPTPGYFNNELVNDYEIIPSFHEFEVATVNVSERSEALFTNVSALINNQLSSIESFNAEELGPKVQEYINDVKSNARDAFINSIAT